ncbi:amino acid adenylation domain-containing protein [Brucellaceae bacterium D45D]
MSNIADRFAHFAATTPDAIAVIAGDKSLTYGKLDAGANRLARKLIASGAGPERIVGVSLPRSLELIVTLLAVLKSGAAYLPLDPSYPTARLNYLASDAKPVALITQHGFAIPDINLPLLEIDADMLEVGDPSPIRDTERLEPLSSRHPAYVIYTSGSTGLPKGVVVEHHSFLSLLDATVPLFDITAKDIWTVFHSYAFDFSVWEIWAPLLTGARTVVVPPEATWSAPDFLELLAKERVSVVNQTPSSFIMLDRADAGADFALDNLRLVIFGGEALDPARLSPWFERRPIRPRMVNMYGITETTVHVTAVDVVPVMNEASAESPIGKPVSGFSKQVFGPSLAPISEGESGELYLGGGQLARGYLARPGLTATRFIADPQGHGSRLYRTGDLVRQTGDELMFIGRADTQLSLRGFRIEPNEIEAALDGFEDVAASAVAVKPDPDGLNGDECLVAYIVTSEAEFNERSLRSHLAKMLPSHLIPSHIVRLPELPLTPNRKLDRAALVPPPSRKNSKKPLRELLIRQRLGNRSQSS